MEMVYTVSEQVSMAENSIDMFDALKRIAAGEPDPKGIAQAMIDQVHADMEINDDD
jgi:hypothetical protein